MVKKWCFVNGLDFFWYLVPFDMREDFLSLFEKMNDEMDESAYIELESEFEDKFVKYKIKEGCWSYSFENPERISDD